MKIRQKLIGSLIALGALGMVFSSGCADNRSSIFIRGAMAIPQDTCTVTADPGSAMLFRGAYDTAFAAAAASEYNAALLVGNQLVRRGSATTLRTETSRVDFYEAEITLTDSAGAAIANGNFVVPVTGFADPGTGTDPGYGTVSVTLIDATSAQAIAPGQEVIANVILRGETLGGVDVETDAWPFPITVCRGCLVYFPPEADDPARPGLDCDVRDEAPLYCRLGQDAPVDCRACSGLVQECTP
jgi:hypothetical protein